MSVVKSKRNESQYKYFVLARRIRREITIFSFENFYFVIAFLWKILLL